MKTLILSCNTGGGHNTAGKAILEEMEARGLECRMVDALSFFSQRMSDFICKTYTDMTLKAPPVFGFVYRTSVRMSSQKRKSMVYYANKIFTGKMRSFIIENGYDSVICTHVFPAEAVTSIRKHTGTDIKCYAVVTDYTCHPFWEETTTDCFFIPHSSLEGEFVSRGISRERLLVTGIPVSGKFSEKTGKEAARAALGIPSGVPVILVMTGSMGFGNVELYIKSLLGAVENACLVVLGGNNEKLKSRLRQLFGEDGRVMVVDFTDRVSEYLDASDIVLTKPGGLSSTEIAVKNVPLIHTAPIPGCETANVDFFVERNMSVFSDDPFDLAQAARKLIDRPERAKLITDAQRANTFRDSAARICDYVLEHSREKSPLY